MSSLSSISSNFFKKSIPLYANSSSTIGGRIPLLRLGLKNTISFNKLERDKPMRSSSLLIMNGITDPSDLPAKSPPEIPTAPPTYKPGISPEMPRIFIKEPQFDPTPPVEVPPPDPLPEVSPFPSTPAEPNNPPTPPGQPEIIPPHIPTLDPPHGPDVIPPVPPEPGFPHPTTQPDIPYPFM